MKATDFTKQIQRQIAQVIQNAPRAIGPMAVNEFKENFRRQGFMDSTVTKWPARKNTDTGRAILVKSGRLRDGIRVVRSNAQSITIGNAVPYARLHNEGYRGLVNVRPHKRTNQYGTRYNVSSFTKRVTMPKRQFIGNSQALNNKISSYYIAQLRKIGFK